MKRVTFAVIVVLMLVGLAISATEGLAQKQGKGKPGGGGADPLWVLQLFINDDFPDTQLMSDRFDPAATPHGQVLYQDHRLPIVFGVPDPCAQFNLSTESSPGRARLLLSRRFNSDDVGETTGARCDLDEKFEDAARTFTLRFDKTDSPDATTGGACACAALEASLSQVSAGARLTSFDNQDPASCTLGLAAGGVYLGGDDDSSQAQIIAWPYEEFHQSKKGQKRSGQSIPLATSFTINFHTDSATTNFSGWGLNSQGEVVDVDVADDGSPLRTVTSNGALFTLRQPDNSQCTDVSMNFEVSFQRFDLNAGQ